MELQSRVHHKCEITCTEIELTAKGKELAGLVATHDEITEEKKEAVSRFKTQLDDVNEKIRKVAKVIETGIEMRPIECSERYNTERMVVETYRMDTGDVISNRPMTATEAREAKQGDLTFDLVTGGKGKKDDKDDSGPFAGGE